jgi:glycerol-3-phosphate dehydrogenase
MDTTIYLDYLANRFVAAGGSIAANVHFNKLEEVDRKFDLVINCAGIGARDLVQDVNLEPHRGQVVIVPKIENLSCAIVCDNAPLMYAIPRRNDCVFGGTNEISDTLASEPATTARIVAECSRVLKIEKPRVLAERVGLRPFRRLGVPSNAINCTTAASSFTTTATAAADSPSWAAREALDTATLAGAVSSANRTDKNMRVSNLRDHLGRRISFAGAPSPGAALSAACLVFGRNALAV